MDNVSDWGGSFWHGLTAGLQRFMSGIPTVLGALAILLIGWWVAGWLGKLTTRLLKGVHADQAADRIHINEFLQRAGTKMRASNVLGEFVKWTMRLVFLTMAADQLGLPQVTAVINSILYYIPNILVAMLVLGVGAFLAQLASGVVRGAATQAGTGSPELLARLAYGGVMAFAIIAAVNQLGISPIVVNTLYIGLVAAISLALGLSFGLGARDTAARLTERWVSGLEETARQNRPTITARSERPDFPTNNATAAHNPALEGSEEEELQRSPTAAPMRRMP